MSWQDILKQQRSINDLIDSVMNKLEDQMQGDFIASGDYDEEMEGYRDASNFTYIDFKNDYRGTFSGGGSIEVETSYEHEEDQEVIIEFDINFEGYTTDKDRNYNRLDLRLGSYTGTGGVYIAAEDWGESDREALELLDKLLDE